MRKFVAHSHHGLGGIALRRLHSTATMCLSLAIFMALGTAALAQFDVETKLTATGARGFGVSAAISGNTVIVGAHLADTAVEFSGAAYLFDVTTGKKLFEFNASDAADGDYFGESVGISDGVAIVGANRDETDAGFGAGSAYLFNVDPTSPDFGKELFKLTASDAAAIDFFGISVAISGNTAIVGAYKSDAPDHNSGSAYLFDVTTGEELFKLTASDAAKSNFFGEVVAISGSTAIVGAVSNTHAGFNSGAAYLFDVTTGEERFKLTASDAAENDVFGASVAIDGNTAIVGAFRNSDAGDQSGSAYLFDVTTGREVFKLVASDAAEDDEFGGSVGISDNVAIVGAHHSSDAGSRSGSAYLFDVATGNEILKLTATDAESGDLFGRSVAISGNNALVGAEIDAAGSAYLFTSSSPPSDLTGNGFVDFEDLTVLLANWNKEVGTDAGNLVNADTTPVNFEDLTVLLADWTGPAPAGSPEAAFGAEAVPEPSSLVLALFATFGLSVCRWRRRVAVGYASA